MNKFRLSVFAVFSLFLFVTFALAQDKVTIYNDVNFQGANMTIDGNWNECCGFQKNIRSIRVPRGYRVTIYSDKNFKGTQALLTEDWNPGQTAWWVTRIRSIRVEGAPIAPPTQASFPVIYAQANFQGPAMAVERDWAGNRDWDGRPHRIRSIRVPQGWRLTLFEQTNYRGIQTVITEDISWTPTAYWNGRVRSIRVERNYQPPVTLPQPIPNSFPVIYAQANFQGPAMAVERDWAGNRDWDGRPHRIRSIRVPQGWYLVLYEKTNFRGKSYNLNSDWTPMPGDYWYGRIKSIKVYQGSPPIQPR